MMIRSRTIWNHILIIQLLIVYSSAIQSTHATNKLDGITIEIHRAEFQHLDTNKDDHLDDDEIIKMMDDDLNDNLDDDDNISDKDVVAFIVELDQDNDGKISWNEYQLNLISDHAPTLDQFLPAEFETIDGFVETANEFVRQQNIDKTEDSK